MRPMSRFEKKFGKYAIPNLSTVLIACYAAGYIMQLLNGNLLYFLTLNPYEILHGQVWRLVSWVLVPPSMGNIFTTLIMLYFYWSIGTTLERTWGTYRYNVYIFSGMLFTVLGSFIAMGVSYLFFKDAWLLSSGLGLEKEIFRVGSIYFSTYYINMSIFLAFAATFPDVQVLLMFLIPIKVKWLGIVDAVILGFELIGSKGNIWSNGLLTIDFNLFLRIAILSSLLNFIVFFFTSRKRIIRSPKQMKRQYEYRREVHRSMAVTKHKCAICGRTDESDPELEFRFCSKCNGNYEYCQEHLFSHKHVL
ncbi:MAG: hypothetical protein HDR11_10870 [Lachnospiraceae bacterium]|nr:hypothetical protein [Lachnospiraceae bacterium]MBD5498248.1 hypothetical protein [Lachnospiraceae bacterium]MBD5509654.1 hypothetical protein [Lachnospiraceae bacterium]